jgi:hypothetical protein
VVLVLMRTWIDQMPRDRKVVVRFALAARYALKDFYHPHYAHYDLQNPPIQPALISDV